MATAKITFDLVAQAAAALIAEGGESSVSVRGIQRELGKTLGKDGAPFGSPNVILPLLREWRNGRRPITASDIALDESISISIIRQMKAVAAEAASAAEARAAAAEKDMQESIDAGIVSEQRIEDLANELATARESLDASTADLEKKTSEFTQKLEVAEARIAELAQDLHDERQRSANAQQELGKAQAKAETVPALEQQIADLRSALDAERKARADADQRAAVAEMQSRGASDSNDLLRAELTSVRQDARDVREEKQRDIESLRIEVREAAKKLDVARQQIDLLHEQLAAAAKNSSIGESANKQEA